MKIVEPSKTDTPLTSVLDAECVYRGFSDAVEYARARSVGFAPRVPLQAPGSFFGILEQDRPVEHVMQVKRQHFVSFSLQRRVACCYATSRYQNGRSIPYVAVGWIAEVPLPTFTTGYDPDAEKNCSQYDGEDDSIWLDPRFLLAARDLLSWRSMWSRARVDDEFLLAHGVARPRPTCIVRVKPGDCDRTFLPWSEWGAKIKIW